MVTLLAGVVLLWVLYQLRDVLLILYVSTLLAIGFSPAVRWLERRAEGARCRAGRRFSILYVGAIGIVAFVLWLVMPPLVRQIERVVDRTCPDSWIELQRSLVRTAIIDAALHVGRARRERSQSPGWRSRASWARSRASSGSFGTIVTMLLLPYYLLVEAESLQRAFLHLFEPERRPRVARIVARR